MLRLPALLLLALALPAAAADAEYRVVQQSPLPGAVRWDYLSFDAAAQRLYIAHGDQVDVVDPAAGRLLGSVPGTLGVHGVALAPELDRGFASSGRANSVTVFALSSLQVLATVPAGRKPDAIVYDAAARRVYVANGESGDITVIDATDNHVAGTIAVGGKLEFEAVDGHGHLYVNVEDQSRLVAIDTTRLAVLARYELAGRCDEPTGLAIDATGARLFVGCGNARMAVVEAASGRILADLPIGAGCDATAYDAQRQLAFASNGAGSLSIIDAQRLSVRQELATRPGARTLALDPASHRLYTVTADLDPPKEGEKRPSARPGSFTLLTIAPR
jgi:YVTN family beta-propeller protein